MTKLNELWSKAKSALTSGLQRAGGGDEVTISSGGATREHLSDRPIAEPAVDIFESESELLLVVQGSGAHRGTNVWVEWAVVRRG